MSPPQRPTGRPSGRRKPDNPVSFTPRAAGSNLTRDQRLLLVALVVSLALHLFIAIAMGNKPMGRFDPALLERERDFVRVRRVDQEDQIIDDQPTDETAAEQDAFKPDLAELSKSLLLEDETPMGDAKPPDEQRIDLREMSEQRLTDMIERLRAMAPDVDLPESMRKSVEPVLEIDVVHVAGGGGTGGAGGAGVSDAELTAAQRLLAQTRLIAGANPMPALIERPQVAEQRRTVKDTRVVNAPLAVPKIDFTDLALERTMRMILPEHLDNDFEYELTRHHRKEKTGLFGIGGEERLADEPGYFRLEIRPKRTLRRLHTMPKDVVFLIDTSGSIPQTWVNQVLIGVRDGLNALNPGDRFNVCFFTDQATFFKPDGLVEYNAQTLDDVKRFLGERQSKGFTDVNRAMTRLLRRDTDKKRVYYLILISDGKPTKGVTATRNLINLITRDNDLVASIYCIGIGPSQDQSLLEFLTYRNKGYCLYTQDIGEAANTVRTLVSRLRYPIMKDLRPVIEGVNVDETFPRDLPNIHQGETFSIYGRFNREREFTVQLIGNNGQGLLDFTVKRDLSQAPQGDPQMVQHWAFWKLHELYNEEIRHGQSKQIRDAINNLKAKYKLKTIYDR